MADNGGPRRFWRVVAAWLGAATLLMLAGLGWLWNEFHAIPSAADLRALFAQADAVEIFRMVDDKPVLWAHYTAPEDWRPIAELLQFRERYWQFSEKPGDVVVVQALRGSKKLLGFDVRGDGRLHLRKAGRWYAMMVDPELETLVRQRLERDGGPVPAASR